MAIPIPVDLMDQAHMVERPSEPQIPDTNTLLHWFKTAHHGQIHPSLDFVLSRTSGLSFCVRETSGSAIAAKDPVVVCPLSASLSYLNAIGGGVPLGSLSSTEAPAAFPAAFMQNVPPHVIGRFFLIQQFLQGRDSAWFPYIQALPQPNDYDAWCLPAVWYESSRAVRLLEGTNAEVAAAEMRDRIDAEFRAAWVYSGDTRYTFALYQWAYCIFTSRSFRPSLVLADEVQAALLTGNNDPYRAMVNHARLPAGCGIDDFSLLLPVLDIGNHDPRAVVQWTPVVNTTNSHTIAFRTGTAHGPGEPVFNNYGPKTNSELLVGYGFVLAPTDDMHNDYVHLRKRGHQASVAGDAAAGAGNTKSSATAPDRLLSLRPIGEPSSVVGRMRLAPENRVDKTPASKRAPGFALFEDDLLFELMSLCMTAEQRDAVLRKAVVQGTGDARYLTAPIADVYAVRPIEDWIVTLLDLVFGSGDGDVVNDAPDLVDVRHVVRVNLLHKLDRDVDVLSAKWAECAALRTPSFHRGLVEDLALQYRSQYVNVLVNAINVMNSDMEDELGSDDDDCE